jgi:hypothetical protein
MFGPELADRAHVLAVWCQVLAIADLDRARRAEYERWATWLRNSALATRLEIDFVRSLCGPKGRIADSDQALLEAFSRFTLQA